MNLSDMSIINMMKERVENATIDNITHFVADIPTLLANAEASGREVRLALFEVARSIIIKIETLDPNIVQEPGWEKYVKLKETLDESIMTTRFAIK